MEEMLDICCGLDVHKDTITACVMTGNGRSMRKEIKTFPTFTQDIRDLAKWLKSFGVKKVAVESTGIYWKPIFNILEEEFEVILVNPYHAKNVPGRKTDVKDSEWLCGLLKRGMLRASFIPPRKIIRLREFVRYRTDVTRDLSRAKSRLIKMLENANIKLSSVFTDVFGVTAWLMIGKLVKGETRMDELTSYVDPRCKSSRTDIEKALEGTLQDEDRDILGLMMNRVTSLEAEIAAIERRIQKLLEPFEAQAELLQTIPGIKEIASAAIIAEIGVDMNQFHSAGHLTAWAGLCPGANQSGAKKKDSRIRKGNIHLKVIMSQVAWAVTRTKKTYLGAKYRALAPRRGKKRAVVAIGRKTLVICYHMLKNNMSFQELGVDFLNNIEPERKAKYFEKRLEELGFDVSLKRKAI